MCPRCEMAFTGSDFSDPRALLQTTTWRVRPIPEGGVIPLAAIASFGPVDRSTAGHGNYARINRLK